MIRKREPRVPVDLNNVRDDAMLDEVWIAVVEEWATIWGAADPHAVAVAVGDEFGGRAVDAVSAAHMVVRARELST